MRVCRTGLLDTEAERGTQIEPKRAEMCLCSVRGCLRSVCLVLAILLISFGFVGCGGRAASLNSTGTTSGGPPPSLVVEPTVVQPGDAVTVTWKNFPPGANCNFTPGSIIDPASGSGSFTLHPRTTETYIVVDMSLSNPRPAQTVTVLPGNEKYILVGDPNDADVQAAAATLQQLSTQPVMTQTMLPLPGRASCIVIDETATAGPNDQKLVESYLSAGEGVVLLDRSPMLLATGDLSNTDTCSIASWFGATKVNYSRGDVGVLGGGYVPVPVTITSLVDLRPGRPNTIGFELNVSPLSTLDPTADPNPGRADDTFNGTAAFGFRPKLGGRLFWQVWSDFGVEPELLASAARWAAVGP